MIIKTFSDGTQTTHTSVTYDNDAQIVGRDYTENDCKELSVPIPEVELLMRYTKWLDRRGFFREDLQCDFEHQIKTFLNDFNVDNLLNELNK